MLDCCDLPVPSEPGVIFQGRLPGAGRACGEASLAQSEHLPRRRNAGAHNHTRCRAQASGPRSSSCPQGPPCSGRCRGGPTKPSQPPNRWSRRQRRRRRVSLRACRRAKQTPPTTPRGLSDPSSPTAPAHAASRLSGWSCHGRLSHVLHYRECAERRRV